MGGRRDDSAPGRSALPPVPARPVAAGAPARGAERRAVGPAIDEPPSGGRRGWLAVGLVLAAGATAAVFFTEDPRYLRVALLAVCWAFVVAAFLAGNRRADQVAAAAREAELRHAYDLELEREVAARHEYEAELERRLRRDAEGAVRTELAGLSALREDLAAVSQLRADLAGVGELRADLGRIRTELTEQLSGELLFERMVMRAQSVRGPVQAGTGSAADRTLEGSTSWDVDRWTETRVVPAEPVEPAPRPIGGPPPVPRRVPPPVSTRSAPRSEETTALRRPPSPLEWLGGRSLLDEPRRPSGDAPGATAPEPAAPHRHRRAAPEDADLNASGRSATAGDPVVAPYEAPADETPSWQTPAETPAWTPSWETPSFERPSSEVPSYEPPSWDSPAVEPMPSQLPVPDAEPAQTPAYDSSAYDAMLFGTTVPTPAGEPTPSSSHASAGYTEEPAPRREPEPAGHARLEQILAESGVAAPSGGRSRRRRHRDEDAEPTGDDVLARVLGR